MIIIKKRKKTIFFWLRCLLTLISPQLNSKVFYWRKFGKKLNLLDPDTFNEKVNWLKLFKYADDPLVIQCADKYKVRSYVEDLGCGEILIDLLGVYSCSEEINFEELPEKFAIKSNYASGMYIVCTDKTKLDISLSIKIIDTWNKSFVHLASSEMHYGKIPKKIICESFIDAENGTLPDDYKVYCFDGKPEYVMLCKGRAEDNVKFYYFDRSFKLMKEFSNDALECGDLSIFKKPAGWEKLFDYAEILSKGFPMVRLDFYLSKGNIYFGEFTFTPAAGFYSKELPTLENVFGDLIKI